MRGGYRAALAMAALLASLSLVAWRQGRAYEAREALEELRTELALSRSSQLELKGEIRFLTSRERIRRVAEARLGLKAPSGQVIVVPVEGP